MTTVCLKRVIEGLFSLFVLVSAVFFVARLTGDPGALYLPVDATDETIAEFNRAYGFDQPIYMQFGAFLLNLLRLDFGESLRLGGPAFGEVLRVYPATLGLALATISTALLFGVLLGSTAALYPGSILDRISTVTAVSAASIPEFWLALTGIIVFAITWGLLPTSGMNSPLHWILPVAVLTARPAGSLTQVVRGALISVLSSPYIEAARGRGISEPRILFLHALRNAALPGLTVLAVQIASVLNGAVVVETIFGWPGIGRLMITSILNRDFPVLQAAVVLIAISILVLNVLMDVVYGVIDPRVRTQ
jgi:peptide/nickel transport system permease protein